MKKKKATHFEKVKPTADRNQLRQEFYAGVDVGKWSLIETVRRFRIMLGMSQKDFAEYTGVTPRAIMEFEQGLRNPTIKTIERLLKGSGLQLSVRRSTNPFKG